MQNTPSHLVSLHQVNEVPANEKSLKPAFSYYACAAQDQIKSLRDVFTSLDKNGDGLLTWLGTTAYLERKGRILLQPRHAELKDGLAKAGLKDVPPDLAAILDGMLSCTKKSC